MQFDPIIIGNFNTIFGMRNKVQIARYLLIAISLLFLLPSSLMKVILLAGLAVATLVSILPDFQKEPILVEPILEYHFVMTNMVKFARILALAITLLAISLVILPSSISSFAEFWSIEPWFLLPFRIIADLAALLACSISLVLIWRVPTKAYVLHLVFFLSVSALAFAVVTLNPLKGWPGFEEFRWPLVILLSGVAAVAIIRFLLNFHTEYKIVEPITNKRHIIF